MSLYKDASLVMIPSAYKDGKLYSIRPTDGSGDFTFSRGSNLAATRVDVNGLIEKGRENQVLLSNAFTGSTWFQDNISQTTGFSDPFGGDNASKFLETTANNQHRFFNSFATNNYSVYTQSVYIQPIGRDQIAYGCQSNTMQFIYEFSTQTFVSTLGSMIDYGVTNVGSGWYRLHITFSVGGAFNHSFVQGSLGGSTAYAGDVTKGFYVYGSQLEAGLVATDYIETGTSAAQSGILEDMPRLDYSSGASCPSLLLEPSRTSIITQSEYFEDSYWSKGGSSVVSGFTSPEGLSNAYKLVQDTSSGVHKIVKPYTGISGTNTASIFVKAGEVTKIGISSTESVSVLSSFDLSDGTLISSFSDDYSITPFANDWYRISSTDIGGNRKMAVFLLNDSGSYSYTGDGTSGVYIYGAQLETGSYPTSYIPTYGTSQTRSGEGSSLTGASSIIGQTQGTIFVEYDFDETRSNNGGSDNDIIHLRNSSGELIKIVHYGDGSGSAYKKVYLYQYKNSQYEVTISSPVQSTGRMKVAAVYRENYYALFLNGVKIGEDLNAGVPNLDLIYLNKNTGLVQVTNPRHQAVLFPTALTDSECIALTTL